MDRSYMITDNNTIARFMAHVLKVPEGCWEWTASKNSDGYGQFKFEHNMLKAHRISYRIYEGPITPGLSIAHSCDNPGCVNPKHLKMVTHQVNMDDREAKGRGHNKAGEANGRSILTADDVRAIRKLYPEGKHTQREIGSMFGISHVVVSKVVRRDLWKSVE